MSELGEVIKGSFPPEPPGGWHTCSVDGCGARYASMVRGSDQGGMCPTCADREHDRGRQAAREARRPPKDRADVLAEAGVPKRIRVRDFVAPDEWPTQNGGEGTPDTWTGEPEILTLCGRTDAGKSMMAAELLSRTAGGLWVLAADVPQVMMHDADRRDALLTAPLVVVDELGRGHEGNGWERLYRLIGGRWEELLPTIITTNLELAKIGSEKTGHPALARRIAEGWWVPLRKSWRER